MFVNIRMIFHNRLHMTSPLHLHLSRLQERNRPTWLTVRLLQNRKSHLSHPQERRIRKQIDPLPSLSIHGDLILRLLDCVRLNRDIGSNLGESVQELIKRISLLLRPILASRNLQKLPDGFVVLPSKLCSFGEDNVVWLRRRFASFVEGEVLEFVRFEVVADMCEGAPEETDVGARLVDDFLGICAERGRGDEREIIVARREQGFSDCVSK
jgi:hypothetical protein